jgi:hypothetical protein
MGYSMFSIITVHTLYYISNHSRRGVHAAFVEGCQSLVLEISDTLCLSPTHSGETVDSLQIGRK